MKGVFDKQSGSIGLIYQFYSKEFSFSIMKFEGHYDFGGVCSGITISNVGFRLWRPGSGRTVEYWRI